VLESHRRASPNSVGLGHVCPFTGQTERDGKTNLVTNGVLKDWHMQNGDWQHLARQVVRLEEPRTNSVSEPSEPRQRR
jgi:hypothetical protein